MGFTLQNKNAHWEVSPKSCQQDAVFFFYHTWAHLGDCSADQYFIHFSGWKSNLLLSHKNSVEPMNLQISLWVIRTPFSSVASFFLWFLHICTYEDLHIDTVVRTMYRGKKKSFIASLLFRILKASRWQNLENKSVSLQVIGSFINGFNGSGFYFFHKFLVTRTCPRITGTDSPKS